MLSNLTLIGFLKTKKFCQKTKTRLTTQDERK